MLDRAPIPPAVTVAPVTLRHLGWVFLRIGALAFGGLGAGLALIERDLVERRKLLAAEDVTEALTYTKLLPGSTLIQVVSFLGFKLRGWPGSALATTAFILPSALLMTLLAALYGVASELPAVGPAANGLTASVLGLLLSAAYRLGGANIERPLTMTLALLAFAAGGIFDVSAALIVVASGLVGILCLAPAAPKEGDR